MSTFFCARSHRARTPDSHQARTPVWHSVGPLDPGFWVSGSGSGVRWNSGQNSWTKFGHEIRTFKPQQWSIFFSFKPSQIAGESYFIEASNFSPGFFCDIFSDQTVSGLHYPRLRLPDLKIIFVLHLHYSFGKAIAHTVCICYNIFWSWCEILVLRSRKSYQGGQEATIHVVINYMRPFSLYYRVYILKK